MHIFKVRHVDAEKPTEIPNETIPVDSFDEINNHQTSNKFELLSTSNEQSTIQQQNNDEWNKLNNLLNENTFETISNGNECSEKIEQPSVTTNLIITSKENDQINENKNENGNANDNDDIDYVKIPVQQLINTFEKQTKLIINQKVNTKLTIQQTDKNEKFENLSMDYQNQCQINDEKDSSKINEISIVKPTTNGHSLYQTFMEFELEKDEFTLVNDVDLTINNDNENEKLKKIDINDTSNDDVHQLNHESINTSFGIEHNHNNEGKQNDCN